MQSNPTPLISRCIYNVWFIINISLTIVDNTQQSYKLIIFK